MEQVTLENWFDCFNRSIVVASLKARSSIGAKWKVVTVDQTWGDYVGMMFVGENAKRAATYFKQWADRNLAPLRNYDNQISIDHPEFAPAGKYGPEPGYVVRYCYYPCNE